MESTRVGIIVIGDEILSGDTQESNAYFMARHLARVGAELRRILVVPDETGEIARHVGDLSPELDVVITCGGIGPTHDDVTMDGIARAFDVPLIEHPKLLQLIEAWRGEALDESHRRLARVPRGVTLLFVDEAYPLIQMENVYILPGVPRLLRGKFPALLPYLQGEPLHQRQYHTRESELSLAQALRELQDSHPKVSIGSYPISTDSGRWEVRLVLKARDPRLLEQAGRALSDRLGGIQEIDLEDESR